MVRYKQYSAIGDPYKKMQLKEQNSGRVISLSIQHTMDIKHHSHRTLHIANTASHVEQEVCIKRRNVHPLQPHPHKAPFHKNTINQIASWRRRRRRAGAPRGANPRPPGCQSLRRRLLSVHGPTAVSAAHSGSGWCPVGRQASRAYRTYIRCVIQLSLTNKDG